MARASYSTHIVKQLLFCPKTRHKLFYNKLIIIRSDECLMPYSQNIHKSERLTFSSSSTQSAKAISKKTVLMNSTIKQTDIKKLTKSKASTIKFKCPHCNFLSNEKDSVKSHIKKEHNLDPFSCPHCAKGFTNFKTLNKHITTNHPSQNRLKEPYEQVVGESNVEINNSSTLSQPKGRENDTHKHVLESVATKIHIEKSINDGSPSVDLPNDISMLSTKVEAAEEKISKPLSQILIDSNTEDPERKIGLISNTTKENKPLEKQNSIPSIKTSEVSNEEQGNFILSIKQSALKYKQNTLHYYISTGK